MRTFSPKLTDITRQWWVIDANDLVLGRLSTEAARILKGKHKPIYAPHMDTGDHVIVINAEKVVMTAGKADRTFAYRHTGYPGGLVTTTYAEMLEKKPADLVRNAIKGMLPKGPLGRQMMTKLKVYAGPVHSHHAQQPKVLEIPGAKSRLAGK